MKAPLRPRAVLARLAKQLHMPAIQGHGQMAQARIQPNHPIGMGHASSQNVQWAWGKQTVWGQTGLAGNGLGALHFTLAKKRQYHPVPLCLKSLG